MWSVKGVEVTVQSEDVPRLGWRRLGAEVTGEAGEVWTVAGTRRDWGR